MFGVMILLFQVQCFLLNVHRQQVGPDLQDATTFRNPERNFHYDMRV